MTQSHDPSREADPGPAVQPVPDELARLYLNEFGYTALVPSEERLLGAFGAALHAADTEALHSIDDGLSNVHGAAYVLSVGGRFALKLQQSPLDGSVVDNVTGMLGTLSSRVYDARDLQAMNEAALDLKRFITLVSRLLPSNVVTESEAGSQPSVVTFIGNGRRSKALRSMQVHLTEVQGDGNELAIQVVRRALGMLTVALESGLPLPLTGEDRRRWIRVQEVFGRRFI